MSDLEVALRLAIGHEKSPDPRTALPALARVLAAGAGAGCVAVAARAASRRPLIGVTLLLAALRQAQGILGGFRAQFRATTDGDLTAWEQALRQCGSAAQFNHDVVEAADSPLYAIAVSHREGNSIQDLRLTLVGWQLGRLIDAGAFAERVAVGAWIRRTLAPDESREGDQRRGAAKGRPRRRRRTRIAYTIADSAAARLGLTLFKRLQPPPRVQVTSYEVSVPRLPRELDGLRILHLSDLHVHPGSDLAWQTPELVAGVPHDLVCYTGDFIDVDRDLPDLARLLARMPSGAAYAVLGNHDHIPFGRAHLKGGNDTAALRAILAGVGIRVLTNEARPLFDGALYLAGVDDPATDRDDLDRAFAAVPASACTVLLAHSPDVVLRLGERRPDLILAGHTHGGQVRLPIVGMLVTMSQLPRHLVTGLVRYQDIPLFISRGIGYSGMPIRIGSPAEVALLTLRAP
jgi:hypothetical protein